jgi:hypothetical protein
MVRAPARSVAPIGLTTTNREICDEEPPDPGRALMAPLDPREKALLIYALAVYSAQAHGGTALTSTPISRTLDSEQLADIDDLVQRRIDLDHRNVA